MGEGGPKVVVGRIVLEFVIIVRYKHTESVFYQSKSIYYNLCAIVDWVNITVNLDNNFKVGYHVIKHVIMPIFIYD